MTSLYIFKIAHIYKTLYRQILKLCAVIPGPLLRTELPEVSVPLLLGHLDDFRYMGIERFSPT